MSIFNTTYDIIIVGGGHAGCESALAGAKMGKKMPSSNNEHADNSTDVL